MALVISVHKLLSTVCCIDVQFRSLSLIPSSFLFKISDYWGNMQQKDAQDVLTQVSLLQYVFRQCVPYNRICIPTPLPTQRLVGIVSVYILGVITDVFFFVYKAFR